LRIDELENAEFMPVKNAALRVAMHSKVCMLCHCESSFYKMTKQIDGSQRAAGSPNS